jgi:hypothetical protein
MEEQTNKNPIKVFRCGHVKAAIWSNSRIIDDTLTEVHSIKIDRSYKGKDSDEWKNTNTFNAEDLPKVALVAGEVYKFLRMNTFEPETQQNGNNDESGNEQNDNLDIN